MSSSTRAGQPAVLGGKPVFSPALGFTRPAVPAYEELEPHFRSICETGYLTKGPQLARLESRLSDYIGVPVVCVHSCTSGLLLGIQSLKLTGEVIVPSFSFPATFHALRWNGLTPVFAECEPDTLTLDPRSVESLITPRTSAIMSAYLFGNPPDFEVLDTLAQKHGLAHFCDSAHGMGTKYLGKPAGGRADFEVFSASPTKVLTAAEGGIVATRRADIAEWIRVGRDYGNPGDYDCRFAGLNARMSEFHAALCLAGFDHLDEYVARRREVVGVYRSLLGEVAGIRFQTIRAGCETSNKDFPILVGEEFGLTRDELRKALEAEGIPTRAYFHPAGHHQTPYRTDELLPVTEKISDTILCLPISSVMTAAEASRVAEAVASLAACASDVRRALGA